MKLTVPFDETTARSLRAGDVLELSGTIYIARDAAHARLLADYEKTGAFPFPMENAVIYYAGPSPARPGRPMGSVGPTTSYRMDGFTPRLIALGQRAGIGKGLRSPEVKAAMKEYGAVYLGATGGAGALLAQRVKAAELVAYPDLGAEAVYRLTVEDFPVIVVIDALGNDLYETGRTAYAR